MDERGKNFPNAATFASSMGQAVGLMTVSKAHRKRKNCDIEDLVTPEILLQQFKIYMKDKQPIAFLARAYVSADVKDRFESGNRQLEPHEWRSASNVANVECVSTFAERTEIEKQFSQKVKDIGNG